MAAGGGRKGNRPWPSSQNYAHTQKTEAKIACKVLNIMTNLGKPVSRRIA